ncbi:MAG: SUF system NifU family Fe-S cluster assembly protein [Candidatus Melainabacteria bacterium]|nr:SUF system NifU family Fe-S cluster assembly protein [Candidatus Melainabacteria bacterium]
MQSQVSSPSSPSSPSSSLPHLDELYKEIILEHYRKPHGRIPVDRVDCCALGVNPLCGDEVKLCLKLNTNKIENIHVESHGCSISVASGSILADILKSKTLDEAKLLSSYFKSMMHDETSKPQNSVIDIGDLEALAGVKKFPVRIKCALLPWMTFEEALIGHDHIEIS